MEIALVSALLEEQTERQEPVGEADTEPAVTDRAQQEPAASEERPASESPTLTVAAEETAPSPAASPAATPGADDKLVLEEPSPSPNPTALQDFEDMATYEPKLPQAGEIAPEGRAEAATQRRLRYHVALSVRTVYDDNINLSQVDRQSDFYTTIEPTIEVGIGQADNNFLDLTYSPNAFLFVDHSENNALQHLISLSGQYRFPRLSLNLSQEVQILEGTGLNAATGTGTDFTRTNLDVSGRTRLNIYTTRLSANYSLTGKTFLTTDLHYSVSDYATLISSSVLSGNVYFNYTYSPKLAVGVGVSGGYNSLDAPSQDQVYEQINTRASYELTGKVSATLSAGLEFRQVPESGAEDNGSPVFEGSLFYQPFDGTSLAFTLSRRTLNSATLASQDLHSTSFILSGRQRFLQRLYLGLTIGYENSEYFSTISELSSARSDDYYFVQAALDLDLTRFWTAGLYYFYRRDDSSLSLFSFYDNQFGLRTSLKF